MTTLILTSISLILFVVCLLMTFLTKVNEKAELILGILTFLTAMVSFGIVSSSVRVFADLTLLSKITYCLDLVLVFGSFGKIITDRFF